MIVRLHLLGKSLASNLLCIPLVGDTLQNSGDSPHQQSKRDLSRSNSTLHCAAFKLRNQINRFFPLKLHLVLCLVRVTGEGVGEPGRVFQSCHPTLTRLREEVLKPTRVTL